MNKKWQVAPQVNPDFIQEFPEIPPLILQLMHNRGLLTQIDIDEFLKPDYSQDIHSPWLFRDMKRTVEEIFNTIKRGDQITVYGDYDADGLCGMVILMETLLALGAKVDFYVPHREKEGYGLNEQAIKDIADNGTKLIISVDCGITNHQPAALINELGLKIIITDHHQSPEELPAAFTIINPMVKGEKYPFKELAGVGVAYKLVQALVEQDSQQEKKLKVGFEKWLLDLVAIATITDMVSLLGENRTLVNYGLVVLNKTRRLGLKVLMKEIGLAGEIMAQQIGFQIGPRLNAAGRLNHANIVFKLLTTGSRKEAKELAQELNRTNQERQRLTDQIITEIKKEIGEFKESEKIIIVIGNNWPIGVVGLVAGKLSDEYYRPVFVITSLGEKVAGSGRSIPEFNITDALKEVDDLLQNQRRYFRELLDKIRVHLRSHLPLFIH